MNTRGLGALAAATVASFTIGCSSNSPTNSPADSGSGGGQLDSGGGGGQVDSAGGQADSAGGQADSAGGQADSAGGAGNAQTPPMGGPAVEAWIANGAYNSWSCEPAVHASRSPSPHGFNRICSNGIISSNATATGPWPQGAAAVKELWAAEPDAGAADGAPPPTAPVGYAVYLKTAADSAAGANWYWYERVPLDNAAPHDANGVVADGLGSSGPAQTICVACHSASGSDTAHTPSPNGHDEVYTPVP